MRIGVFLPHWLGDACMATPALRAISDEFHGRHACQIVAIGRRPIMELLSGATWFDQFWIWEKTLSSQMRLVRSLRKARFDHLFILPGSLRTGLIGWLGGARSRIGYSGNFRNSLLTDQIHKTQNQTLVKEYLTLARLAGCRNFSLQTELPVSDRDTQSAANVWKELRLGQKVIGLNCGSANSPSRRWGVERFAQLAREITRSLDRDVLVLCGPGEEALANKVVALADQPQVRSFANQPMDLGTSKAVLARLDALVSTDSGPRHIASAMQTPVVGIYGPIRPEGNSHPGTRQQTLIADLPCIGCGKDACPLTHHRCMSDISVDQVLAAVRQILSRRVAA